MHLLGFENITFNTLNGYVLYIIKYQVYPNILMSLENFTTYWIPTPFNGKALITLQLFIAIDTKKKICNLIVSFISNHWKMHLILMFIT